MFGDHIEPQFLELLEGAKSNIRAQRDGRWLHENLVLPGVVDLVKVAAHYAVSSLFEEYSEHSQIYSYTVDLSDHRLIEAGRARLAVGRADVANTITLESATVSFGVLHLGDHNVNAGVREYEGEDAYQEMVSELSQAFKVGEFPEVIRAMDRQVSVQG